MAAGLPSGPLGIDLEGPSSGASGLNLGYLCSPKSLPCGFLASEGPDSVIDSAGQAPFVPFLHHIYQYVAGQYWFAYKYEFEEVSSGGSRLGGLASGAQHRVMSMVDTWGDRPNRWQLPRPGHRGEPPRWQPSVSTEGVPSLAKSDIEGSEAEGVPTGGKTHF